MQSIGHDALPVFCRPFVADAASVRKSMQDLPSFALASDSFDFEAQVVPTYPFRMPASRAVTVSDAAIVVHEQQHGDRHGCPLAQPVLAWQMVLYVFAFKLIGDWLTNRNKAAAIGLLACLVGLSFTTGCSEQRWREIRRMQCEVPAANLPLPLRQENWADRNGSGSCVIASTCSALQWAKQPQLAAKFRRSYAGGQTATSILDKWRDNRIRYVATEQREDYGNPEFLEWASKTRRMAIVWFFPNHCVSFCGFGKKDGQEVAWLLDNNRTKHFIPVEKNQFISGWRGFGGFAAIPTFTPAPSIPFKGYE